MTRLPPNPPTPPALPAAPAATPAATGTRRPRRGQAACLALAAVAAMLAAGIYPRLQARAALAHSSADGSLPAVATVRPRRASAQTELVLPADVRAYQDAPVYARVSGYLRRWVADIGTPVRQGQLLAEIDAPEISDQLRQARAEEAVAAANYDLARRTAERWQDLLRSRSVAQQEADQKSADMQAKAAALASARSNVARLAQQAAYTRIVAPFDGVVTARNVDTGALVDAGGNGGPGKELFHLSAGDKLRIYIQVPQDDSVLVTPGMPAWLSLPQYPGQRFAATVTRSAGAIDAGTRSLRVELEAASAGGRILPGAYAEAHLSAPVAQAGWDLPASTLLFRAQGPRVAVVGAAGTIELRPVTLGRDFGSHVEIASGLQGGEQVVANPGDGLMAGVHVRLVASRGDQ
ncbi:efflux transporter periplasmic adaptor subunit [Cupriavidus sp. USMAA2-4]|uniref:efflux RND transporter periplasmic adaptor subunit n=1 Tax=Cupriavidus sp. USMAA2-4 TaxID=876364 RepID=UPI0008A66872|nr:efflux RND transporter periplasmic adaptor subunit [Cupriavidus sp. USMAA2-4]AOY96371.1 efflux transporter periplasmic adaptor subunit [Cupriavidus sp. USMAA2-4]